MNEVFGTLTVYVHVIRPDTYRGEKVERHQRVAAFRRHGVERDEAQALAKLFGEMNPELRKADLYAEWTARENLAI